MRISTLFGLVLALLWSVAEAQTLRYQERELSLQDKARACYLVFVKLYDAEYFRSQQGDARCVRLEYLRAFNRDELVEATEKIFRKLHGEQALQQFSGELESVARAYEPVAPGSRYQYCVGGAGVGEMIRDGRVLVRLQDADFSERLMNIWVLGEQDDGRPRWNFARCPGRVF
jgi:hypothetical protein